MALKEGLARIYIVLSVLWAIFCFLIAFSSFHDDKIWFLICISIAFLIGILLPIVVYKVLIWIIQGFKND